ncbi:MAG: hypothetical protein LBI48_05785 [Burkholderiaceae bacterium]|jgi:hypothetical protein|nr:hypothetical protein [Burkholderiaceae bacterium]
MVDTPGATAFKPQTPSKNIGLLQSAIRNMDGQAREGLGSIGAVAYLAMRWLETPDACRSSAAVLHTVLGLIQERADNCLNLIAGAADGAGCSAPREHKMRRAAAAKAVRNS